MFHLSDFLKLQFYGRVLCVAHLKKRGDATNAEGCGCYLEGWEWESGQRGKKDHSSLSARSSLPALPNYHYQQRAPTNLAIAKCL